MWHELVFLCEQGQAEAWSDCFFDLGALSITVEDADRDSIDEQPMFGEPGMEIPVEAWRNSRMVILLDEVVDPHFIMLEAVTAMGHAVPEYFVRQVSDQDWVRLTQSQFEPIEINERLWIVPTWHELMRDDVVKLALDPGLAFGTGSHPTTQLCLRWISDYFSQSSHGGQSLMDYGCGSGILAIAAKKFGAGVVHGVDIDAQAMIAARQNAAQNLVDIDFSLAHDNESQQQYQVVVANILSNPLKALAPLLSGLCAPNGHLVLSGILVRQIEELQSIYAPYIALNVWQTQDEWVCLHGQMR